MTLKINKVPAVVKMFLQKFHRAKHVKRKPAVSHK